MQPHHPVPPPGPRRRRRGTPALAVGLWVAGWPITLALMMAGFTAAMVFLVISTIAMIVAVVLADRSGPTYAPIPSPYPPPPWPVGHPATGLRAELEDLACVSAIGGCGWCGSPTAHLNDAGYPVHPRHWHAAEIEERLRGKLLP